MNKLAVIVLCGLVSACGGAGVMTADELIEQAQKETSATISKINQGIEFSVTPSNVSQNKNVLNNSNPYVLMYLPAPKEGDELWVIMAGLSSKEDAEKIKGPVTIKCSKGNIENNAGAVGIALRDCSVTKF